MTYPPPPHEAPASADDRATGAETAHDLEAAADAALAAWDIEQLQRLTEIGMETAEKLLRKAAELTSDGTDKCDAESCVMIARAHKDVATAIQTSIALKSKLVEDRRRRRLGLDQPRGHKASARPDTPRSDDHAATAKPKDPVQPVTPPDPTRNIARNLFRRIADKLLTGDLLGKLANLDKGPVGVTIAKIAKSLDMEVDWQLYADEPWAQPEIARRDQRSPFAFLWADEAKVKRLDPAKLKKSVWLLVDHVITGEAPEDERDDCWRDAKEMLETEFDWETEERGYGEIAVRIIRELGFPCGYAYNYQVNKNYGPAMPKTAEERAEARSRRRARPPPDS
jgi:hypothetical protein